MGKKTHTKPYKKQFIYNTEAVATDHSKCSQIGEAILHKNGTAVDAAIASVFCLGVVNPHSSGIGGGGFALVYTNSTDKKDKVKFIDFREQAPSSLDHKKLTKKEASEGGNSIAIPGELYGMYTMWKNYGKLEWSELLKPAIELARNGHKIGKALAIAIDTYQNIIMNNTALRQLFSKDGKILVENEVFKNVKLANFLEKISSNITESIEEFYREGDMLETMIKEIKMNGGCPEIEDFQNYKVRVENPLEIKFDDYLVYTGNAPTSGPLLAFILKTIKNANLDKKLYKQNKVIYYHKLIEILKFAYSLRSNLADHEYESISRQMVDDIMSGKYSKIAVKKIKDKPYDKIDSYQLISNSSKVDLKTSTTHLNVLDKYGNAVAITSTINAYFGSKLVSEAYGFIYNNQIDDFSFEGFDNQYSLPYSHVNAIKPGKRPQSSALLAIIVDQKAKSEEVDKRSLIFKRIEIKPDSSESTTENETEESNETNSDKEEKLEDKSDQSGDSTNSNKSNQSGDSTNSNKSNKSGDSTKSDKLKRDSGIFLIGGSGGSVITSGVAESIINHLVLKMSLKDSIDQPRLHNQLTPNTVFLEDNFDKNIYNQLKKLGHKVEYNSIHHAVVQGISTMVKDDQDNDNYENDQESSEKKSFNGKNLSPILTNKFLTNLNGQQHLRKIYAESDYRKGGNPSGF